MVIFICLCNTKENIMTVAYLFDTGATSNEFKSWHSGRNIGKVTVVTTETSVEVRATNMSGDWLEFSSLLSIVFKKRKTCEY